MKIPHLKNVFIVIPVHNRKALTRECLLSLQRQTLQCFTIIIVDDGSTDGTAEMIGSEFPDVVLVRGDGNLWWSGATNRGVEYIIDQAEQNDYILTLNNDTTVQPNYLEILLDSALRHPGSLIGSIAISDSSEPFVVDGGVQINWITAKFKRLAKGKKYKDIGRSKHILHPVDFLPGRGTLIPVKAFRELGIYNSALLPHYGADYEFSYRAKKNGFKLFVNYEAVIFSNVETTGLNNENCPLPWREYFKSFYYIRSPYNIRYRWNFARLTCPRPLLPSFFILDLYRIFFGTLRNQFRGK